MPLKQKKIQLFTEKTFWNVHFDFSPKYEKQ